MDMEKYVQEMNRQFVIRQILDKLEDATMPQLIEIGKILKI